MKINVSFLALMYFINQLLSTYSFSLKAEHQKPRKYPSYGGWIKISKNPIVPELKNTTNPHFEPFFKNLWWKPEKQNNYGYPISQYAWYIRITNNIIQLYDSYENLRLIKNMTVSDITYQKHQRNIYTSSPCFTIKTTSKGKIKYLNMCPLIEDDSLKIYCRILDVLKKHDRDCRKVIEDYPQNKIIIKKVFQQPIFLLPIPSTMCNEQWDYSKQGEDWTCDCKKGKNQSPIDLPIVSETIPLKGKPIFYFTNIYHEESPIKFSYEDNVLKLTSRSFGQVVTQKREPFNATEIVFHTPSEHSINGKFYDMEMQVIYKGTEDLTKKLILVFLIEKAPGKYNQFFDQINLLNIPTYQNRELFIKHDFFIPKIFYSDDDNKYFLPKVKPFSFYKYEGSLTRPPCSEKTSVYVVSEPIKVNPLVIEMFKEAIETKTSKNPKNNRKIQNINQRVVYHYADPECPKIAIKLVEKRKNLKVIAKNITLAINVTRNNTNITKTVKKIFKPKKIKKSKKPKDIHLNLENPIELVNNVYDADLNNGNSNEEEGKTC